MARIQIMNFESLYIKDVPLYAEAIASTTLLQVGDLLRWEAAATATDAGCALFDTASEYAQFVGCSLGDTTVFMVSGAYGDHIPIVLKGIIKAPLSSANYNFGASLGYSGTKNTFVAAGASYPHIAWYFGSDADSITSGLVLIDVVDNGFLFPRTTS